MIVYRKKFLRIVESWGEEEPSVSKADLLRRFQQTMAIEGMLCREFFTILIDLCLDESELLARMNKGTRYEIRRAAASDNLRFSWSSIDDHNFYAFCDYYDRFALQKKQPRMDRKWLSLLAKAGCLRLSQVNDVHGSPLVYHAYLLLNRRATLLHSVSLYRSSPDTVYKNMVARANRFQHWQDMLQLKREGTAIYDFGGWYDGQTDRERLDINKFKEGFGGQIVKTYICERALTVRAKVFLKVRQLLLGNAI